MGNGQSISSDGGDNTATTSTEAQVEEHTDIDNQTGTEANSSIQTGGEAECAESHSSEDQSDAEASETKNQDTDHTAAEGQREVEGTFWDSAEKQALRDSLDLIRDFATLHPKVTAPVTIGSLVWVGTLNSDEDRRLAEAESGGQSSDETAEQTDKSTEETESPVLTTPEKSAEDERAAVGQQIIDNLPSPETPQQQNEPQQTETDSATMREAEEEQQHSDVNDSSTHSDSQRETSSSRAVDDSSPSYEPPSTSYDTDYSSSGRVDSAFWSHSSSHDYSSYDNQSECDADDLREAESQASP